MTKRKDRSADGSNRLVTPDQLEVGLVSARSLFSNMIRTQSKAKEQEEDWKRVEKRREEREPELLEEK